MLQMMMTARQGLRGMVKNEQGAVAIEYVLLGGLIAVAIIVGATTLGGNLNTWLGAIATKISTLAPGS